MLKVDLRRYSLCFGAALLLSLLPLNTLHALHLDSGLKRDQAAINGTEPSVSSNPSKDDTSKSQQHGGMHKPDKYDVDDQIELPRSPEDVERIMNFPHVEECNYCKVCVPMDVVRHHPKVQELLNKKQAAARALLSQQMLQHSLQQQRDGTGEYLGGKRMLLEEDTRDEIESNPFYSSQGHTVDLSDIAPGNTKAGPRMHMPNCTVCWGCTHTLELMASGQVLFGNYYAHEPGGSPSWLFRVRTNRTESGWAVVKTWCVPVQKAKQRGLAMCSPKKVFGQVKLLMAQAKVTAECGLNDIVPDLWVEPIHGIIPGNGFRIDWMGLWADIAEGVSVQNIQEFGRPKTSPEVMIDLFTNKVNHTEIKLGAIFDVLFSQCDRHQQNIFVREDGQIRLIDNDQVYGTAWRRCGVDSMLLPTTQKYMINHLGFFYVLKYPHQDPPTTWSKHLNPLLLLDYRCHVNQGMIGKDFPPSLKKCMAKLSKMSKEEIQHEYGYPIIRMADAIRNRSHDMLTMGFEWTLLHGQPTNQPMHRYKVAPPCCRMGYSKKMNVYVCKDAYHQMTELPYGNPWHGGKWHGPDGKDTGTYVGGTVF